MSATTRRSAAKPDRSERRAARRERRLRRGPLRRVASFGWRVVLLALFVAAGFGIGGFLNFTRIVMSAEPPANLGGVRALVVPTGGAGRIEQALELLDANSGRLLVSGVNEATGAGALQRVHGGTSALYECCIDLGYEARDTPGNARETAAWAKRHGVSELAVVTSDFHMPRTMLEMRRAMPDVSFIEVPVRSAVLQHEDWYARPGALRLLMGEWAKYLSALSRDFIGSEPLRRILPG